METLGSKIRSLRKARHLTQVELGGGEVSASLISQIESNRIQPSEAVLEHICQRLGVEPNYFSDYIQTNEHLHLYRRAKHLLEREAYNDAAVLYERLLQHEHVQDLKTASVFLEAGQCYQHLNQLDRATLYMNKSAEASLESDDPATAIHTYYQLGNIQRRRNLIAFARMFWVRARELLERHTHLQMPVSVKIHANLARAYYILGQYEDAKRCYRVAVMQAERISAQLDMAAVTHGLANVLLETGEYEEAKDMTRRAMSLYDDLRHQRGTNQCKINFVVILRREGRHTEALSLLQTYLDEPQFYRDPIRHANALSERALCLLAVGHDQEALKDAQQAVLMVESDREMWLSLQVALAQVYVHIHRFTDALALIERMKDSLNLLPLAQRETLHRLHIALLMNQGMWQSAVDTAAQRIV